MGLTLEQKIEKARNIVVGILTVVEPVAMAMPIINTFIAGLSPEVQQKLPPEEIHRLIEGWKARDAVLGQEFNPPSEGVIESEVVDVEDDDED